MLRELGCFDSVIACKERTCCSNNVENRYCIGHNGNKFCLDYRFKGEAVVGTLAGDQLIRVSLPNMVAVDNLVRRTRSVVLGYNL